MWLKLFYEVSKMLKKIQEYTANVINIRTKKLQSGENWIRKLYTASVRCRLGKMKFDPVFIMSRDGE